MKKHLILFLVLLYTTASLSAQQDLNLGFERQAAGIPGLPWNWQTDEPVAGITQMLDSTISRTGKFSLRLSGTGTSPAGYWSLTEGIEAYSFKNKKAILTGYVKTAGFSGTASLQLGYYSDSSGTSILKLSGSPELISGSHDWQQIAAELFIPPQATSLIISVRFSGSGNAWFDDLRIQAGRKTIHSAAAASPFSRADLRWLQQHSKRITTVDAHIPNDNSDLESFRAVAGDARIIALGETTHGTSEIFRLKQRLLAWSVQELGVRIFAIEDNQLVVERVNRYVLHGTGTSRGCMYGMFGVWQTQEVHELIQWIRNYNILHPDDPVYFTGFDMQNFAHPYDSLLRFVEMQDKPLLPEIKNKLAGLAQSQLLFYTAGDSLKSEWQRDAAAVCNLLEQRRNTWLAAATSHTDSLRIEKGIQHGNLIRQFVRMLYLGYQALYRDSAMAENISWILAQHKPGTRMVVWAHDVHISRGEDPVKENNYYNGISMGSHLARKYGNHYKAFGMYSFSGFYRAQVSYSDFNTVVRCPLCESPQGSLDEALHRVSRKKNSNILFLDLRGARSRRKLANPLPVRFANHVCMAYGYWTQYTVPYQFDGLFFIDVSQAARPAANK